MNEVITEATKEKEECPYCGSTNVKQVATHGENGYEGYECQDCGCTWGDTDMTRNEYLDSTVLTDSKTGAKVTIRDFYGSLGIEFDEAGHVDKNAGLGGGCRPSGKAAMMHSRRRLEELADWCIGQEDDPGVRVSGKIGDRGYGTRFVYLVPVEVRARAERLGARGYE